MIQPVTERSRKPDLPTEPTARRKMARDLWQRFFHTTEDLKRYIDDGNIDDFLEIAKQRLTIGDCLIELKDTGYIETDECKELVVQIRTLDEEISTVARSLIAKGRRRLSTASAYNPYRQSPIGNILNLKK